MSKISLSPSPTGSAVYTIASPAGSTDRTLNLPDAAGTVFVGGQALSATTGSFSGNVTLGSSVLETPTGSAPAYLCRAWVNFDGNSSPINIRGSGNVSSITDNGVGNYTVNFTTAMSDAFFCAQINATRSSGGGNGDLNNSWTYISQSTTTLRIKTGFPDAGTGVGDDSGQTNVAIFR